MRLVVGGFPIEDLRVEESLVSQPNPKIIATLFMGRSRVARRWVEAAKITVQEIDGEYIVAGPYGLMKEVYPKLKSRGFRYNSTDRSWRIPLSKLTPQKRTGLLKLLGPYLGEVETQAEKIQNEIARRIRENLSIRIPYEYRNLAKEEGGLWDTNYRTWAMPDQASIDRVLTRLEKTGYLTRREQSRRVREKLTLSVPYEHRDIPEKEGGAWSKDLRMWTFPDKKSLDRVQTEIESLLNIEREEEKREREEKRQQQEAERAKYIIVTEYGRSKGEHHDVGETFRDRKTKKVVTVVKVESWYIPEDGMSLGLGHLGWDRGWIHTLFTEPAETSKTKVIEQDEQERLTKGQAVKRERELADKVGQKHNYVPSAKQLRLGGESLLHRNRRQQLYGGGSWWVIQPGKAIWYVRNNGADGDAWDNNNVMTGGAGAIGYRVPYDEGLAQEIRYLDALVGEK